MNLEIDVSGTDIFDKNYSICLVNNKGIIKSFKITRDQIRTLRNGFRNGKYTRINKKTTLGVFKVKIYLIILKYLLTELFSENEIDSVSIVFCPDFPGHENSISTSLRHHVENIQKKELKSIKCHPVGKKSDSRLYATITRKDIYNYLSCSCKISLEEIERHLILDKSLSQGNFVRTPTLPTSTK